MTKVKTLLGLVVVASLALSGCSSDEAITPAAFIASGDGTIGIGEQRIMIALVDVATNEFLAADDRPATALLRDEDGTPIGTYDLDFLPTVPDVRGIYLAEMDIPEAGVYQVTIDAEGLNESGPTGFVASEDPVMVSIGEEAPPSETRTITDHPDLSVISSDPEPDPVLYGLSVDQAVTNGTPAVVVFATPAFCASQACGPMLDQVKAMRSSYPGVDFVHVEVYDDLQVTSTDDLQVVDAIVEWGLPSEPWIYVVDKAGTVSAVFEGAVGDAELGDAIAAVAGE
jgi:hypothetical protein